MFEFEWDALIAARTILAAGAVVTLQVTLVAVIGGFVGGIILALCAVSGVRTLQVLQGPTLRSSEQFRW